MLVLLFVCDFAYQQNITGTFSNLANQQIKLVGFNGFATDYIFTTPTIFLQDNKREK